MDDSQPTENPYARFLGIDCASGTPNHYTLLGLPLFNEDAEAIDEAAKKRAAHLHQLASGPERQSIQKLMGEIAVARRTLTNGDQKRIYDEQLKSAETSSRQNPSPVVPNQFEVQTHAEEEKTGTKPRSQKPKAASRTWFHIMTSVCLVIIAALVFTLLNRNGTSQNATELSPSEIQKKREDVFERLSAPQKNIARDKTNTGRATPNKVGNSPKKTGTASKEKSNRQRKAELRRKRQQAAKQKEVK